jgi:hypothetical protein
MIVYVVWKGLKNYGEIYGASKEGTGTAKHLRGRGEIVWYERIAGQLTKNSLWTRHCSSGQPTALLGAKTLFLEAMLLTD